MSVGMIIVILVSLVAGTVIRAWAFMAFAAFVALARAAVVMFEGQGFAAAGIVFVELLVIMQVGYAVGVGLAGLYRHALSRRRRRPGAKEMQARSEHPPH